MRRACFALLVTLVALASPARAYDSKCYVHPEGMEPSPSRSSPACSVGPGAARNRWIGQLDEHRRIFERTRQLAGLPAEVSEPHRLRVFVSDRDVTVDGVDVASLDPAAFERASRAVTRTLTAGELAQLPDFSYGLWDWASGNETCPISGAVGGAEACHSDILFMGAVNSNHFLPQAGEFYAYYHGLALERARECRAMSDALREDHLDRFESHVQACEVEALMIEAVGQHFLQDAWSSGHMWQRWGSPDPSAISFDLTLNRARMVAATAGIIHGARSLLQDDPLFTALGWDDVNDALCAPRDGVAFLGSPASPWSGVHSMLGDLYLDFLFSPARAPELGPQHDALIACGAGGLREVYGATGQRLGMLGSSSVTPVPPTITDASGAHAPAPACFGQRAINGAVHMGMGIDYVDAAGVQQHAPLTGFGATSIVLADVAGLFLLADWERNLYRLDLARIVSVARIRAAQAPLQTDLADGGLEELLGIQPNAAYAGHTADTPYIDPPLPWPGLTGDARAQALARTFHRAHATDLCASTTSVDLAAMRSHAQTSIRRERATACEVCAEIVSRHLRIGSPGRYDSMREPLCRFLVERPAYEYQEEDLAGPDSDRNMARRWCGCPTFSATHGVWIGAGASVDSGWTGDPPCTPHEYEDATITIGVSDTTTGNNLVVQLTATADDGRTLEDEQFEGEVPRPPPGLDEPFVLSGSTPDGCIRFSLEQNAEFGLNVHITRGCHVCVKAEDPPLSTRTHTGTRWVRLE